METIKTRCDATVQALSQLKKSLDTIQKNKYPEIYEQLRDSLIQRFEFSFDSLWKYLKEYLRDDRKVELDYPSPNKTFKTCYDQKVITKEELEVLLDSTRDRNLTSHTYSEKLAEKISKRVISSYYETMKTIVDRLK